jgi:hypothetical protein
VVVVELVFEDLPAEPKALGGSRVVLGRCRGCAHQRVQVAAEGIMQDVHDGEIDGCRAHDVSFNSLSDVVCRL